MRNGKISFNGMGNVQKLKECIDKLNGWKRIFAIFVMLNFSICPFKEMNKGWIDISIKIN